MVLVETKEMLLVGTMEMMLVETMEMLCGKNLASTAPPPDVRYRLESQETDLSKSSCLGSKTLPDFSTPKAI